MGGGTSLLNSDEEILIKSFEELYCQDPARWDRVIAEGKRRHWERAAQASANANANANASANTGISSNSNVNISDDITSLELFSEKLTVQLNLLRRSPGIYLDYFEKHLKNFVDDYIYEEDYNGAKRRIQTKEGKNAVIEAIQYVKSLTNNSLPILQNNVNLVKAALDHCKDIGASGSTEHVGSDNSHTRDRVSRYCVWKQCVGENIDFGNMDVNDIIVALVVDDGVAGRGHRVNMFSPSNYV